MNIYDKALSCLNDLGHETDDEFNGFIIDCYEDWYFTIEKALERAKKEHELLGLYKNQSFHFMQGNMIVAHRLQEKINKLEKELEELK